MFEQIARRLSGWLQQMVLQPVVDEEPQDATHDRTDEETDNANLPNAISEAHLISEPHLISEAQLNAKWRTQYTFRGRGWPSQRRRTFRKTLPRCRPPLKSDVDRESIDWLDRQLVDALSRDWVSVPHDLCLQGSRLRRLPDKLSVVGTLDLRNCRRLRFLGQALRVVHDLWIGGQSRPPLATLPELTTVSRDLVIQNCDYLSELPCQLVLGRNLHIQSCRRFESLAGLGSIKGNLTIIGCPKLTGFPAGLRVDGDLRLVGVPLKRLPEGLQVGRSLILQDCNQLTELPSNLHIPGRLTVRSCPIKSLPKSIRVGEHVRLTRCADLTDLGSPFSFPADLIIEGCRSLEALPPGLRVPGRLTLRQLAGLTSLPLQCKVDYATDLDPWRSGLVIEDCPRLAELPADMEVKGVVLGKDH